MGNRLMPRGAGGNYFFLRLSPPSKSSYVFDAESDDFLDASRSRSQRMQEKEGGVWFRDGVRALLSMVCCARWIGTYYCAYTIIHTYIQGSDGGREAERPPISVRTRAHAQHGSLGEQAKTPTPYSTSPPSGRITAFSSLRSIRSAKQFSSRKL